MIYRKLTLVILFLVVTITGCSYSSSNHEDNIEGKRIVPVEIERVKIDSIEDKYFTVSRVEALNSVIVTSPIEGKVEEVFVKSGDMVEKGQLLYRIMADENLKDVKLRYESALEEQEDRNKVFIETKDQFEKMNYLYEQGTISETQLRESNLELEQSKIQLNLAKQALETAREVYNISKNRYEIKSHISGYITMAQVKAGQNVTYEKIIKINGSGDKIVEIGIPEEYISKVTLNTESKVKVNSTNKIYDGKVIEISPEINRNSGLYTVKVRLKDGNDLIDGFYSEVELILNVLNNQIMIPNKAIIFEGDEPYIFKVSENNSPLKTKIDIGLRKNEEVQVLKGLSQGDRIIVKGQHFIDDNSSIEIMDNK